MIDRRRATFAGLAAVPLLLLATACKDDASGSFSVQGISGGGAAAQGYTTSVPSVSATAPSTSDTSGTGAEALTGAWSGHYVCTQGPTNMKLTLTGAGSRVSGTFEFSPLAGSDNPSGSYSVKGTLTSGKVILYGDRWIEQPSGYVMVDFEITTITPTMLRGDVHSDGCTTFQVSKQS